MKFIVANDNGNSEQKISVDGNLYRHPNVYGIHYLAPVEEYPLDVVMDNLLNNLIVTVDSKTVSPTPTTYMIGKKAVSTSGFKNTNITRARKHEENTPLINTLGFLAALATKKRYEENGKLENGETIELEVDMTTALPASVHDEFTKKAFAERFTDFFHEVKVHYNNVHTTVKLKFNNVKVVAEGVPALFSIIEDGKGNYRNDDMFDEFKTLVGKEEIDGEYFTDKRLLHVDIGDGTTELTYTQGYEYDKDKSKGLDFGLGASLEDALIQFLEETKDYNLKIKRQDLSMYLKDKDNNFHDLAMSCMGKPLEILAADLLDEIKDRASDLKLEFDIIVIYGGASILLKDALYPLLVEKYKPVNKEILWLPKKYAIDMNVKGMEIYNTIAYETQER